MDHLKIKGTSESTKYKQIFRAAVLLLTNQLQQETFIERKLRSVSVFLSPPQRQFVFTLKKFAARLIIALDFNIAYSAHKNVTLCYL